MKKKKYCVAFGCLNNNGDRDLMFHTLPRDIERRRLWLTSLDREDLLEKEKCRSYVVCSAHFDKSSFKVVKRLKEDAVPKLKLPDKTQDESSSEAPLLEKNEENSKKMSNKSKEGASCLEASSSTVQIKDSCSCKTVLDHKIIKKFTVGTQTEDFKQMLKVEETETTKSLTENAARKRKLVNVLNESELRHQKDDHEIVEIKVELEENN